MAERRMFSKTIIDSDLFLDMPSSTQNLYFHLAMRADDDGFVNAPFKIMRMVSCSKNDMDLLIAKQFIIPFESGICVIKHWKIHNYIRSDRYIPTMYSKEKNQLELDEHKVYNQCHTTGIPSDIPVVDAGKVRLGEDSLDKDKEEHSGHSDERPAPKRFIPPTIEQVSKYCEERNNNVDPQKWIDHYTSNGWKVGKNAMKDWKAAVRTWERSEYGKGSVKDASNGRDIENPHSGINFGF